MLLRYIGNSCQVMCKHAVQKRYLHAGIVDTSTTRNGTAASVIERPVLHSNNVSSCSRTCVLLLHQGQPRTLCHTKQFLAKGAQRFYKFPLYLTSLFIDAVWPLCQKAQFCVADCKESESLDNIMERMTTTLEECLNHLLPDLGSFHCSHAFLHEEPSIDNVIRQRISGGLEHLILLPIYAHYSCFRTGEMLNTAIHTINSHTFPLNQDGQLLQNRRTVPATDVSFKCSAIDRWSAHPFLASYWHQQIRRKIDDFDSILFVAPQMRGYASKHYSREVWSTCQRVMNQLEDRLAWRTAWFGAWDQWPSSNLFESIPMQLYLLRRDNKQHTLVVPITSIFPDFNTQALLPRILPKEGVEFVNPASHSPVIIHGFAEIVKNHLLGRPANAQFSTRCSTCFNPWCHLTRSVLMPTRSASSETSKMTSLYNDYSREVL